jgi:hypothetical protein
MPLADRQQVFHAILEQLATSEAISLALLANEDGFLVAAAPETEAVSVMAAVGASLHQLADRVAEQRVVDEITIRFGNHQRLVCRSLPCERADMLLGVVVQPGQSYRHLTNQVMREICAAWRAG